ncbi:MAG: T9SS type A sorting domain-containing protein [Ignavibacteriaceae bacterium]
MIQNCNQGVYVYNASPQIINNQITNPSLHGIYVDAINKSPLIQDNSITKTSGNANYKHQEGIILYNGTNGYITHNSISGFDHGIYVGGSNAYFTDYTWQNHFPNNKFTFNRMGVQIGWGAFLIGGYGTNICWNNNISNNDYYNIFVYASSRALVQNNYWGVGNLKQYLDPTSTWEILPALSTDPWLPQGGSQAIAVANTSSSEVQTLATTDKSTPVLNTTSMAKGHVSNDLGTDKNEDEILKEIRLEKEGKIDEAIEYLKKMVKNKKNSLYAITALGGLKERYGKENVQLYFEDLLKDPNEENKSRIKKHLAGFYLNKDEDDKATAIFDELRNDKSSKRDNFEGLLDKFNYILHKKKDIISAKNLLAEMKNKFSDDEDAIMHISTAEMLITEGDNFALGKKQNKTEATLEIEIPKEYALFNNYPNPFNPVTTITYQLPKEGLVTLKIYDVLGNEVKTLVNEQKEMGKYTVQFDASSLASGMYVYQLRVNDYTSTKKMILVK